MRALKRMTLVRVHTNKNPQAHLRTTQIASNRGVGTTLEVVRFLNPRPFIFSQTYLCESYLLHVILREEFNCGIII